MLNFLHTGDHARARRGRAIEQGFFRRTRKLMGALVCLALLHSCATPNREVAKPPAVVEPAGTPYGPEPTMGPEEPKVKDRWVVVLDQGFAKGFAYVGFFKALDQLSIRPNAVYATEVGALAAAIQYTQPNPNRVDWAHLRFTEKNLKEGSRLMGVRLNSPEAELEKKLIEVFAQKKLREIQPQLHIRLEDPSSGAKRSFDPNHESRPLWEVLRAALSGRNGIPPVKSGDEQLQADSRTLIEVVQEALEQERGNVLVVSAGEKVELDQKMKALQGLAQVRVAFLPITLDGLDDLNIRAKSQAQYLGKAATLNQQKWLRENYRNGQDEYDSQ